MDVLINSDGFESRNPIIADYGITIIVGESRYFINENKINKSLVITSTHPVVKPLSSSGIEIISKTD